MLLVNVSKRYRPQLVWSNLNIHSQLLLRKSVLYRHLGVFHSVIYVMISIGVWWDLTPPTDEYFTAFSLYPVYHFANTDSNEITVSTESCNDVTFFVIMTIFGTISDNNVGIMTICAAFCSHWWIQTGVTVWKRLIWVKIDDFFSRVTLKFDGWPSKTIGHLS